MRIESIRLQDVRRFSEPVSVEGIGPGLNLLCAPNEAGKSTIFDALHAAFFLPHRSRAKEAAALRALAGGAPEVAVGIETAEGRFEILKRWFSKPCAEVRRAGTLIAKADEAEAWIARVLAADGSRGPAGLLWVRQGETGLDASDPSLRRDLLSSVTGEVEAMTGGRRMDRVRARCREELERYATPKGKPRTGGPWRDAQDEVETLEEAVRRLAEKAAELRNAIARRRDVRRETAELNDPEATAARRAALDAAQTAHDEAERHAGRLQRAEDAARMARLTLAGSEDALARLRRARAEAEEAAADVKAAETAAAEAKTRRGEVEALLRDARAEAKRTEDARTEADRTLSRAHAAAQAEDRRRRRSELAARLARAEALRADAERLAAEAAAGPDAKRMRALEALALEVRGLRVARDRALAAVVMRYSPGGEGGATLDGAPLPDGERVPIPDGAELDLRGLGRLVVEPGRRGDDAAALRKAEAALAEALAAAGAGSLDAAREAADRRAAAESARLEAMAKLAVEAPDGLDKLRADLAALPDDMTDAQAPPVDEATAAAEAARAAHDGADRAMHAADRAARAEQDKEIRAEASLDAARDRAERARRALAALPDADDAALAARIAEQSAALDAAEVALEDARRAAPDLDAAEAELRRAKGVAENADRDLRRLAVQEAELSAAIALRSGEAVEEELADATARLDKARETLARIEREVRALTRLGEALDEARSAARDRWFAPVMAELRPLLSLLWEDAELRFDEAEVLPAALTRRGTDEPFGILSGGTQEQIAILVRLAFARMLAADGRPAPVILDDALVHSDDDRIERMFQALHRQAKDMQIIVLSCRQRAFRNLGARALALAPAPERVES